MLVEYRPATEEDVGRLLLRGLRASDELEVTRASGQDDAGLCLYRSWALSDAAEAAYVDGKIVCMYGAVTLSPLAGIGAPWFLATEDVATLGAAFLRRSRQKFGEFFARWPALSNIVDAEHAQAIAWLKWLGFTVEDAAPVKTTSGYTFYHFWRKLACASR